VNDELDDPDADADPAEFYDRYPTLCPYCDGSGMGQSMENNTVCRECRGSGVVRQVEERDD
jgi:DnaJ-class molecular chaperone